MDKNSGNNIVADKALFIPAKIGVIGHGVVGQALTYGFSYTSKGRDQIMFYDKFKPGGWPLKEVVSKSDFIFICLPTPMKDDESGIDLSIIEESIDKISKYTDHTDKVIVIKSTVVPGTTRSLIRKYPHSQFCFNPEFLTEANSVNDFLNTKMIIIGAENDKISRKVGNLYSLHFPNSQIEFTDSITAEMVKYFRNSFLAMKVIFANTWYDFCLAHGVNYKEVKRLGAADPRIVDAHLNVTNERGFGKKCLPKDLVALIGEFRNKGVDASLFEKIWEINKHIRKIRDW
ncbi:MAG: hypothetical protein QXU40_03235 [Candidatus Pacearchaeota archaeon]